MANRGMLLATLVVGALLASPAPALADSGTGTYSDTGATQNVVAFIDGTSHCWSWTIWRKLHNALGTTVAKYSAQFNWCGNGSKITSRQPVDPMASVYWLGWRYNREVAYWNSGGVGSGSWTHYTQGSFSYDIPLVGVVQNWYPWLKATASANGVFHYSTG